MLQAMDHIVGRLGEIARNIEIVGADPVTRHGFTQVPNVILADNRLSVGAKLAYANRTLCRCATLVRQ